MDHQIASNISTNIKQLREARGLTQEQLAKLSGIPRPTWSNMESGSSNPTITVLVKVAAVLQVSVEELIGSPRETCKFYPVAKLTVHRRGNVSIRKILPDPLPGIEFERLHIPIGSRMAGIPHRTGTREYLTCERGRLQLAVAGETWDLGPGDVVVFRGDQRHSYTNIGEEAAIGYSVVMITPV
jgi:transcriptional regulator with XRE-family HTH domain